MKVAVCDDQDIFLNAVYKEIKDLSYLNVYLFNDSTKLAKEIENGEYYDLFILDIEMPDLDGVKLVKVIQSYIKNPVIIFMTSYTDYVYNAFEVEAFRFIPKENMQGKILTAIEEYENELSQDKYFYIMSNVKKDKILLSDIMYIDYKAKYISYHMKNGEVKRERKHLHTFMDNVKSDDFIFINKGTIVNMKNTKYVEGHNLMMKNMKSLSISINTIKKVKNQLLEYWNNQNEYNESP